MTQETIRKLNEMKLHAMAEKLGELQKHARYSKLSHDEVLAFLVDAEYDRKKNNQISRLLGRAKNRLPMASIEEIIYSAKRNLRKETMRDIFSCNFLKNHQNILISGPTGVGKTFVASALINLACRNGFPARYFRLNAFLKEVATQKRIGNYLKAIEKMGKIKLLVIDDIGPGGHFLSESSTLSAIRSDEWYLSDLGFHGSFEDWLAQGKEPLVATVNKRVDDILATHKPLPLDESVENELVGICRRAREAV